MAGRKKTAVQPLAQVSIHERVAGLLALTLQDQLVGLIKTVDGIKGLTDGPNAVRVFQAALTSLGGKGKLTIHSNAKPAARKGRGKKKVISEAGKQAIRAAQLKRWAKIKRAKKSVKR